MKHPRFSLVHQVRMMVATALLTGGLMFVLLGVFDVGGVEQRRVDRATARATGLVLCAQVVTYSNRLGQLRETIGEIGVGGLSRNERDVFDALSEAMVRLHAAEGALGIDCIAGD